MIKKIIKKLLPPSVLSLYHKKIAALADIYYHHPSNKMIIIGVTGTKGKTTACNIIWHVLTQAGYKVGLTTTANFRIRQEEWVNKQKMTMLGRFKLQKLLAAMVKAGCEYAVVETSSEGIKQWRHWGINYDIAVFLNLSPEHIEAHGSFENYKNAKGELFRMLTRKEKIINGQKIKKTIIANNDDPAAQYFLNFSAEIELTYGTTDNPDILAQSLHSENNGITWSINEFGFYLRQLGAFNIYNALPAVAVGLRLGLSLPQISEYLSGFLGMPGRMELIEEGQPYKVVVDYCYEPKSMECVFKTIQDLYIKPQLANKIICVFGACGGGRDTWRRPVMGELAAKYAQYSIITTDEPYDDDPGIIADAIINGLKKQNKQENKDYYKILDRRAAIKKAISLAKKDDVVLLGGLGSSTMIAMAKGKGVSWDDRIVAREVLRCG